MNPKSEMKNKNDILIIKNYRKESSTMESCDCVICYEKKAKCFCQNCKISSGICKSCYFDIQDMDNVGCDYIPIKCVICKNEMWKNSLVRQYEFDLESMGELEWKGGMNEEKAEKLIDIIFNAK